MAFDPKGQASLALHRFGLGPRVGSLATISSDPQGALIAELGRAGAGTLTNPDLMSAGEAARAAFEFRQERKAGRLVERAERAEREALKNNGSGQLGGSDSLFVQGMAADVRNTPSGKPAAGALASTGDAPGPAGNTDSKGGARQNPALGLPQQIFQQEARARIDAALDADIGFVERLVWFWSNHLCVSIDKGPVRPLAGAYEREAIRAHVLGRFVDMLEAAEAHPAMLLYLDNVRSVGPDSNIGRNRGKGLNENLAREILELHTLGVRTVYSQDDVTNFAKVITGWSIVPLREQFRGGEFVFNERMHEPGAQTIIGRTFADGGIEQGRAVLAALARHPATARHLADKLARHFVSDQPPPALVDRLAARFTETNGDLRELAITLVRSPEAWEAPRQKLKRPGEWLVSALRGTGVRPPDIRPVMQAQALLGEPLWRPPAPKGFSDDSAAWMDGLAQRLDIANQFARRVAGAVEPRALVETSLGPLAGQETRSAIERAESRPQALALLLMSSEFQRR